MSLHVLTILNGFDAWTTNEDAHGALKLLATSGAVKKATEKELTALLKVAAWPSSHTSSASANLSVKAVRLLAEESAEVVFGQHAKAWFDSAACAIRAGCRAHTVLPEASLALSAVLRRASSFPDVSRHVSSAVAGLLGHLLPTVAAGCIGSSASAVALLSSFPGSCGGLAAQVERTLISAMQPQTDMSLDNIAALYALLARLGGGGKDSAVHKQRWSQKADEFVLVLRDLFNAILLFNDGQRSFDPEATIALPRPASSDGIYRKISFLVWQCECVCVCLRDMLTTTDFNHPKEMDLSSLAALTLDAASVELFHCDPFALPNRHCVSSVWPALQEHLFRLWQDVIKACGRTSLPIVAPVTRASVLALRQLDSTFQDYQIRKVSSHKSESVTI